MGWIKYYLFYYKWIYWIVFCIFSLTSCLFLLALYCMQSEQWASFKSLKTDHLTSIVSVSVSFMSWMFRGITPSAGTGKSISSSTMSFGGGRTVPEKPDMFDRWGTICTNSSFSQLHGLCFRCITDTWTVSCWSSSDSGWSLYVDIFSYKTKTTSDNMLWNM